MESFGVIYLPNRCSNNSKLLGFLLLPCQCDEAQSRGFLWGRWDRTSTSPVAPARFLLHHEDSFLAGGLPPPHFPETHLDCRFFLPFNPKSKHHDLCLPLSHRRPLGLLPGLVKVVNFLLTPHSPGNYLISYFKKESGSKIQLCFPFHSSF